MQEETLYYFENDRVVFTALFHINRGECCGSGCRHCPYKPKAIKGNSKLQDIYIMDPNNINEGEYPDFIENF